MWKYIKYIKKLSITEFLLKPAIIVMVIFFLHMLNFPRVMHLTVV